MSLSVQRLGDHFVGEVLGLDSRRLIDREVVAELRAELARHQILVLREQQLAPEQLVGFARLWGELRTETAHRSLPTLDALTPISNDEAWGHLGVGTKWHSDGMFLPRRSRFSMLYGHRPAVSGGQTLFCNAYKAHDELDDETRQTITGKVAMHMTRMSAPMVIVHPDTQRRALYLNLESTMGVRGLPLHVSLPLLERLDAFISREDLVYRHSYRQGDLVIHDGFATMHRVTPGPTQGLRILYRVTTLDDGPAAA